MNGQELQVTGFKFQGPVYHDFPVTFCKLLLHTSDFILLTSYILLPSCLSPVTCNMEPVTYLRFLNSFQAMIQAVRAKMPPMTQLTIFWWVFSL